MRGIRDIAGLAVNAVLRVDLQPRISAAIITNDLIDARWAIALFGCIVGRQIVGDWYRKVFERQVGWLIFFMVCI